MLKLPGTYEGRAVLLESMAANLDAGIPVEQVLGRNLGPNETFVESFLNSAVGKDLGVHEYQRTTLEASERAGQLPRALRTIARQLRLRAQLVAQFVKGFWYPIAVALMLIIASLAAAPLIGLSRWAILLTAVAVVALGGGAVAWLLKSIRNDPNFKGRWPVMDQALWDMAELAYLDAVGALYRAGVPLQQAHPAALRAVPIAHIRARLFAADQALQRNEPYVGALTSAGALTPETLGLLRNAELAGELESAFDRIVEQRYGTLERRLHVTIYVAAGAFYVAVAVLVGWLVISFYSNLYGSALRGR